jgi:1-acyl-sn-glycerol-3-phosphate acyltransferase
MTRKSSDLDGLPLPSPTRRHWSWLALQGVLKVACPLWLGLRARGVDRIPPTGGGLLLINHQSFLDPFVAALPLSRPVAYLARDTLYSHPVVGWVLRAQYAIPLSRSAASTTSIKLAVRHLEHGFLVGIFPEGTRTRDGQVGPLKPGFVALLRRVNCPVYPVGIAGAFESFPRGARWIRPGRVRVVYGEPWSVEEQAEYRQRGREQELLDVVRNRLIDCQRAAQQWRDG